MLTSWTPTWVAALWTLAFVLAAGVHLRHTISMSGPSRWWHATHVLMALGMIDMFWPYRPMPLGPTAGEIVFAVAGCAALAVRIAVPAGGSGGGFLWEVTIVDLFAMTYMFAEPGHDTIVLVIALSVWFVLEAVGWLSGTMSWAARSAGLDPGPQMVSRSVNEPATGSGPAKPGLRTGQLDTRTETSTPRLTVVHQVQDPSVGLTVRLTLAVMSAGMTFMLLAVHFGAMAAGGHLRMPGM